MQILKSIFGASFRTTAVGVATFLVVLGTNVVAALDSDPKTVFDLSAIEVAFGAMLALLLARDAKTSSQQEGIR